MSEQKEKEKLQMEDQMFPKQFLTDYDKISRCLRYELSMEPDMKEMLITGQVSIIGYLDMDIEPEHKGLFFNIDEKVMDIKKITLQGLESDHSKDGDNFIVSKEVVLQNPEGVNQDDQKEVTQFFLIEPNNQCSVKIPEELAPFFRRGCKVKATFNYTSKIGKLFFNGVFKAKNPKMLNEIDKQMDNTWAQFVCSLEPNRARRLFPCIDQPNLKAVFQTSVLVHHKDHIAVSNTQLRDPKDVPLPQEGVENQWYHFSDTPLMSTYLLTCVVGKYEKVPMTAAKCGVQITGYVPPGMGHLARDNIALGAEALDHYVELFGYEYPLNKLDIICTYQLNVRAMENWGCILFANEVLLTSKETHSRELVEHNARTVCHEISHMWFGNLVTMEWWNDVWLKEGVARYCEYTIMEKLRPEFNSWNKFMTDVYKIALNKDEKADKTHALRSPTPDAQELCDIFDQIAYAKGSIVCRLMAQFAGKDAVRSTIQAYIHTYLFKNAHTKNLLDIADTFVGPKKGEWEGDELMKFSDYITPWIDQPCYPVISVKQVEQTDDGTKFELTQKSVDNSQKHTWPILMEWIDTSDQEPRTFLWKDKTVTITLPTKKPVWFNHKLKGFFKIHYEMPYLEKLANECVKFTFEGDQWYIMSLFFQRFREEGFELTQNHNFGPSIILWKELIGYLGEVITQNYVELHMPQNLAELNFPDFIKRQAIMLFKDQMQNYKDGCDSELLRILCIISCFIYGEKDSECVKLALGIDIAKCSQDMRQVLYFVHSEYGDSKVLIDRLDYLKNLDKDNWEKLEETQHLWTAFLLSTDYQAVQKVVDEKVEYIEQIRSGASAMTFPYQFKLRRNMKATKDIKEVNKLYKFYEKWCGKFERLFAFKLDQPQHQIPDATPTIQIPPKQ